MAAKKNSKQAAATEKKKAKRKVEVVGREAVPDPAVVAADAPALMPVSAETTEPSRNVVTADQPVPTPKRLRTKATPPADQASPADAKAGRLSALDAAARVLQESGTPMTCSEMITTMAEKGYWTSPGGKTPSATLYSAILRELQTKGPISRFVKTERGKFARATAV
jgi:HB1/ASXL restriction endonuclease-like protein with HTH domain